MGVATNIPSEMWQGEYRGNKVTIKSLKDIKGAVVTQGELATKHFLAEASIMT